MDKYLWLFVPVAAIVTGVCMIIWPKEVALQNRDDKDDTSPPSRYEIWYTRGAGIFLLAVGAYGLYRMLGGTWGAGPPGEPFDPVLI